MAATVAKPQKSGVSEMAKQEERLAIWMLLPTFLILLAVALYPLGSVFVLSFTNSTFASSQPTEFVGLSNYQQLLSITVQQLEPVIDPATGEQVIDERTGQPVYQRPVEVLPREPVRYRELTQFNIFGMQFVIGATDPNWIRAVWDTLVFAFFSVLFETILGIAIALIVHQKFKGRGAMRAAMLVPWAIPTAVSSVLWANMFASNRTGIFNTLLSGMGIGDGNIPFLQLAQFQVAAMVIIDVWKTTPFMALLMLAGMQTIPSDIYEAASVDGASKIRQFFNMTLPLLRGTLAVALIFRTLDALRVFDLFQIVLAQSRYSMASFAYYELINNRAAGYSSASSVLIFILIAVFAVIYIRSLGVKSQ